MQPAQGHTLDTVWPDPAAGVPAELCYASSKEVLSHGVGSRVTDAGVSREALLALL